MKIKACNKAGLYVTVLMTLFYLSGCVVTSSIKNGVLEEGKYRPSSNEFTLPIPTDAIVHDGLHPLGGFVSSKPADELMVEQGVAYFRVALPEEDFNKAKANEIVEAGYNNWLENYAARDKEDIIHSEWIDIKGVPHFFAVSEGSSSGLLVKPGSYTGAISFLAGNYSYVVYEVIKTPYQLKGSEDSSETKEIKNAEIRFNSIRKYLGSIEFSPSSTIKFPLKAGR